ncbi:MAG: succinylglutamate desuccinylase/aspartoacylase family protein [Saprospiraceae bacterium]|nr:succinylglutamate desuccinylase/aspartoacylase family protein [Saprospiraceae bacterium]MCB0679717.1 succinylglutamate desuccinylase/aspartoacylase family protein [Saprospiraceae bacterium]
MICLGGMHGNEPAGLRALELMFKMLEVEPLANPSFTFKGRLLGLRGNVRASREGLRYLEKDLNRLMTAEHVARIRQIPLEELDPEDLELLELLDTIDREIEDYRPERLVFLDIHTTTAYGGIFSIATDDPESLRIAVELHAPVITGMLKGIKGTSLHYFNNEHYALPTVAVVFEAGQHEEPLSVNRAIAALTNCMRTIGCVRGEDVENRHDSLLIEYSKGLPKVAELITTHPIRPGDEFRMLPNYRNFQPVRKGELLAQDVHGQIHAPEDGLILMPLYQQKGDDGFFLVRRIEY